MAPIWSSGSVFMMHLMSFDPGLTQNSPFDRFLCGFYDFIGFHFNCHITNRAQMIFFALAIQNGNYMIIQMCLYAISGFVWSQIHRKHALHSLLMWILRFSGMPYNGCIKMWLGWCFLALAIQNGFYLVVHVDLHMRFWYSLIPGCHKTRTVFV